ncbi:MAG: CoA transferase, partial [Alphaproteobacteria bacterium]|nr:CoA transferase [Alphaproteobacteria bacterium]
MSDNVTDFTFLQGVKVIDFTQFEAGPSCTEALAWLGAEVVKIENPNRGDPGRRLQPNKPDTDPYYFHMFNANKKSVAINLKSSEGLDLAKEMIRQADVMMENFAPGAIERMGLSYDVVKEINPGIIYAQVKGFGEGSPFEKNLSFDMIAQACGGTFSVTGEMDGPPIRPGVTVGDTGTGMLMAITILGALYKRRESGEGHRLQVAMQDAMLHYMRVNFATQGRTGKAALRGGSKVPGIINAPMGLYPCAPGGLNDYVYIMTSRANPEHWDRLLTLIGREDLIGDERYLTPADRVK